MSNSKNGPEYRQSAPQPMDWAFRFFRLFRRIFYLHFTINCSIPQRHNRSETDRFSGFQGTQTHPKWGYSQQTNNTVLHRLQVGFADSGGDCLTHTDHHTIPIHLKHIIGVIAGFEGLTGIGDSLQNFHLSTLRNGLHAYGGSITGINPTTGEATQGLHYEEASKPLKKMKSSEGHLHAPRSTQIATPLRSWQ